MIIEDDQHTRNLYKKIFLEAGYEIIEAIDGEQAIKLYEGLPEKPAIVIVDYQIPKMNGLDITKEILNKDPTANIFMISGDASMNGQIALKRGIHYKCKPIKMDEFLFEIHKLVNTPTKSGNWHMCYN